MATSEDDEIKKKCKILIIGAGMAGLAAANQLLKNGISDFIILEARNRIGGRIVSTDTGAHKVELGANWIHGVLGNPMYEIAMANGLVDIVQVPKPHKIVAATEEGKQISFKILQEIYEAYVCFLRRCEEYYICNYLPPAGIHSVGEHIGLESVLYLEKHSEPELRHIKQLVFDCLLKRETCISGCHNMEEIDLLELGSYTELQGGNITLPSGYSKILEPLSRDIPPEKILKKHPVSSINWCYHVTSSVMSITSPGCDSGIDMLGNGDPGNDSDDSDRTVTGEVPNRSSQDSSRESSAEKELDEPTSSKAKVTPTKFNNPAVSIEVICENGEKFYSDHLICTIPLGVLKEKGSTMFTPPLPESKLESINKLLFGTVDKILLEYDRPFLNPGISEVMLLWENANEDISENWYKKIYSFSKITDTLLLGWISGKEAIYMESLPKETVGEICTQILRKFLNDPFIPKPKKCICTSWHTQLFTRGSYTAMAVGASQIDIEEIAKPMYSNPKMKKPTVLFAGEHTHSTFYSTVHGAYLTGRDAAKKLIAENEPPTEIVFDCEENHDLSSWIEGISLE